MRLFQKITFISGLIVGIIYFIYTLSFSSNWAVGRTLGQFYHDAQVANKAMFDVALWALVFAFISILLNSHKNRKFFALNYVFSTLTVIWFVYAGIITIGYVIPLKESFLNLDQNRLNLITNINYGNPTTTIFDLGIVVSIVLFLSAVTIIIMTSLKVRQQLMRAKAKRYHGMEESV